MSYNNFVVPNSGYSATVTEDLDNALRESGIPTMEVANALATRPPRRRPAPTPSGGVTKARQRKTAEGGPLKRIAKACLTCRKNKVRCDGEQPSCGRCSGKPKPCRYDYTEKEHAAQRAAAEYERRRQWALGIAASEPQHRWIQPRSEGPITRLGELAAVPMLQPPSHPGTIDQSQLDPFRSDVNLSAPHEFSPAPYTPTLYSPTINAPTQHTPTRYAPTQYTSTPYAPTHYDPTPYAPIHYAPAGFGQNQFDLNHIDGTLGSWNPRPNYSSQYPQLESLPYDRFHHPQESRFGQGNLSQLSSGSLQYHGAFDSTHGAPIVQPDWNTPYVSHQNMNRPSVPTWSESGLPARSVPWSEPVFDDFGLGSMNNAQTPAESSHHVERARSLASMAAMMTPLEDEWA